MDDVGLHRQEVQIPIIDVLRKTKQKAGTWEGNKVDSYVHGDCGCPVSLHTSNPSKLQDVHLLTCSHTALSCLESTAGHSSGPKRDACEGELTHL